MDDESGDDDRDELTSEWGGESRHDWRGWRNESGSWFQRRGDAYLNDRSVIINENMVGGWDNRRGVGTGYIQLWALLAQLVKLTSTRSGSVISPEHTKYGTKIQNSTTQKSAAQPTFSSFFCGSKYSFLVAYLLSWSNDQVRSGWPCDGHGPKFTRT